MVMFSPELWSRFAVVEDGQLLRKRNGKSKRQKDIF